MTAIEIILIIIGFLCLCVSCFVAKKNSGFAEGEKESLSSELCNNSHFLGSFVTSSSFPYASKDRREANEIVIISDSIDAVKVITIIII